MKRRTIVIFLTAMLMVAAILSFSSCSPNFAAMDEYDRAFAIMEYSEEQMNRLSSYTMEMDMEMSLEIDTIELNTTADSKSTMFIGKNGDMAYVISTTVDLETRVGLIKEETETVEIQGFIDGKMFRVNEIDGKKSALWSSATASEYIEHMNFISSTSEISIDKDSCTEATANRNEDGTWTAVYSGFSDESIKDICSLMGGIDEVLDEKSYIEDFELTVVYDRDFFVKRAEFLAVLASEDGRESEDLGGLELSIDLEFKNIGKTEKPELPKELENCEESFDLRVIDKFDKALDSIKGYNSAEFSYEIYQRAGTSSSTENGDVNFENKNGDITYEVEATTSNGSSTYIYYENNQKKIEYYNRENLVSEDTVESDPKAEADFIDSLLLPMTFNPARVSELYMASEERGIYRIKISNFDKDIIMSLVPSATSVSSAKATITPSYNESGALEKYVYEINSKMIIQSSRSMELTLKYTVIINDHD